MIKKFFDDGSSKLKQLYLTPCSRYQNLASKSREVVGSLYIIASWEGGEVSKPKFVVCVFKYSHWSLAIGRRAGVGWRVVQANIQQVDGGGIGGEF